MTEARARFADLRYQCARTLNHHGQRTPQEVLAELPAEVAPDRNGSGGVVDELEEEVARLLGKPAAVFMLSGTMAQQIALRLHAERTGHADGGAAPDEPRRAARGRRRGAAPRAAHRPVGDSRELIALDDLEDIAEPLAALLLELPQRELGGRLPTWEQLEQQAAWARDRGAAVHLDGARLWECTPHYGRSLAEIAALFDTVYVSLYKVLGGASGCCWRAPRTSSPRHASGATATAARSSRCGRTQRPAWPGCASGSRASRSTSSTPTRSRRRWRTSIASR